MPDLHKHFVFLQGQSSNPETNNLPYNHIASSNPKDIPAEWQKPSGIQMYIRMSNGVLKQGSKSPVQKNVESNQTPPYRAKREILNKSER